MDYHQLHHMNEALTRVLYTRVLCPGDVTLDVGANRGDHAAEMGRLVGNTGIVHAVEPNRAHLPSLASRGSNVVIWPFAAGETLGVTNLYVPTHDDGWASLNDRRSIMPSATFVVRSVVEVPLDKIEEIAGSRPSFVKIDVEEREISALRGLRNTIAASRPVIVFETHTDEIAAFFAHLGYDVLDLYGRPYHKDKSPFANCLARPGDASSRIVDMTTIPQAIIDAEYADVMRAT